MMVGGAVESPRLRFFYECTRHVLYALLSTHCTLPFLSSCFLHFSGLALVSVLDLALVVCFFGTFGRIYRGRLRYSLCAFLLRGGSWG